MKYQETANGEAYTDGLTTILFPFGREPQLVFGDSLVDIRDPERFGAWATSADRRAYTRAFRESVANNLESVRC